MKNQLVFRIVLASEPDAFLQERSELKAFVASLNEERAAVSYELVTEDQQNEDDLGQSFYLLVGEEFPEEENETFHKVYDRFCETGAPAIYTWFRRKQSDPLSQSVKAFMRELDEEIGHFFSIYEELDSLKLGILMELARGTSMEKAFAVRDGAAYFRGERVLSLENLPLYKGNKGLAELLARQKELAKEFAKAAEACARDPENSALTEEKEEVSRKQKELFDTIHKQEEDLRALLLETAGLTGGKKTPTAAQKLAIRELENGNYENAEQILRRADRSFARAAAGSILQADKKVLAGYVSENRLLIRTLMASGITKERDQEIRTCWEETLCLTKEYGLDPLQVKGYASYLAQCEENQHALEVTQILEKLFFLEDAGKQEQAELLSLQGILLDKLGRANESERAHIEAVRMFRELCLQDTDRFFPDLLVACHDLGVFETYHFGKYEQAQMYLAEAEKGFRELAGQDFRRWEPRLAVTLASEGTLLRKMRGMSNLKKAEKKYLEALEICQRAAQEDIMDAGMQLSEVCKNLASLYSVSGRPEHSVRILKEAIDVLQKMAEKSPFLYETALQSAEMMYMEAKAANNRKMGDEIRTTVTRIRKMNAAALKYTRKNERQKRRRQLEQALVLCEELEGKMISALPAADVYHNYAEMLQGDKAAHYRKKGWDIYTTLFDVFPAYNLECIAKEVIWLQGKRSREKDPETLLPYAEQALKLCEKLPEETKELCIQDILRIHERSAGLYDMAGELPNAERLYRASIELHREAEQTNNNQKNLKITEDRLRNLYLLPYGREPVKDHYTEEEIDQTLKGKVSADWTRGTVALSAGLKYIYEATGEEKYAMASHDLQKMAMVMGIRSFEEKEWLLQVSLVLSRQLNEMNPGAYDKEIAQLEEKILAHHKKWKPAKKA